MRIFYAILVSVVLGLNFCFSCKEVKKAKSEKTINVDNSSSKISNLVDSSGLYLHVDSLQIHGSLFVASMNAHGLFSLVRNESDTLILDSTLSPEFEFSDFDEDGFPDLNFYIRNNIELRNLYLFDDKTFTFRFVEDFENFPDPIRIKGTRYYYSYHRSGCADQAWDSDLFKILNYRAVRLGNIAGRGCGGTDEGIYISKVVDQRKVLLEKLPLSVVSKYEELKWGFIADYWNRKYRVFAK